MIWRWSICTAMFYSIFTS